MKPHRFLKDEPYNGEVTIPRNLLEDILMELTFIHGLCLKIVRYR